MNDKYDKCSGVRKNSLLEMAQKIEGLECVRAYGVKEFPSSCNRNISSLMDDVNIWLRNEGQGNLHVVNIETMTEPPGKCGFYGVRVFYECRVYRDVSKQNE